MTLYLIKARLAPGNRADDGSNTDKFFIEGELNDYRARLQDIEQEYGRQNVSSYRLVKLTG